MRRCRRPISRRRTTTRTPAGPMPAKAAGSNCSCPVTRTLIGWSRSWNAPGDGWSTPQTGCSVMSRARSERNSEHRSRTAPAISKVDTLATSILILQSNGEGFVDISDETRAFVAEARAKSGLVTLFLRHTSASLTIQENADGDVLRDLVTSLQRLAPVDGGWRHTTEGPDDMPAHIKTMLTATSLQIPVIHGELMLGTWQAIYLIEHRARPHKREVVLQFVGEAGA